MTLARGNGGPVGFDAYPIGNPLIGPQGCCAGTVGWLPRDGQSVLTRGSGLIGANGCSCAISDCAVVYTGTFDTFFSSVGGATPPNGTGSVHMGSQNVPSGSWPTGVSLRLSVSGQAKITLPDVVFGASPPPADGVGVYFTASMLGFPSLVWYSAITPPTSFATVQLVAQSDDSTPYVVGMAPGFDWHIDFTAALVTPGGINTAQSVQFQNFTLSLCEPS